jgi:predicted transcriptional regulator
METIAVQIELIPQQFEQVQRLARTRRLSPTAVLELAIEEWLNSQAKLEGARFMMRELGQGLGQSTKSNNIAEDHDSHLYGIEQQ